MRTLAITTLCILTLAGTASANRDIREHVRRTDPCLAAIIDRESNWNHQAVNSRSGAYGLPQALPAHKMASAGPDWRTNPWTQLRWMRSYTRQRYGGSCSAWRFWQRNHWY